MIALNTAIISHPSGATLRMIDGEQYDVIRDGRHVGSIMDTSEEDGAGIGSARAPSGTRAPSTRTRDGCVAG